MPAEPSSSSSGKKPPERADEDDYEPSIADPDAEPGDINEILDLLEEPLGKGDAKKKEGDEVVDDSSADDLEELDAPHNLLTHFPKSKACEICRRAKMTSRYHRRKHDIDPEETPPLHFGHQLRVDHIILGSDLTKGSEGEQSCVICYDEYSGCFQAFPQTSRTTDSNISCLQKFGGTKAHGKALCSVKSDCAQELTEAVKYLGWLPEPGIPHDPFHNAKLESNIRRIKEGVRAIHLAAGFPHELWPRSIEYFCVAKSFTTLAAIHPNETDDAKRLKQGWTAYEAANNGEPFEGYRVPLGALVYYKPPSHTSKPAFEARTVPGIFAGWRLDSGYKHKKVHLILDYESLRTKSKGFGRPLQVYADELVIPESLVFPLFNAAKELLEGGSGVLPKIAFPFEEGAPMPEARKRKTYVTLERAIRFGITPGCQGCAKIAEGVPHTDACHDRFRTLIENEKLAKIAKERGISAPETPAPKTPAPAPSSPGAPLKVRNDLDAQEFFQRCHEAPGIPSVKKNEQVSPEKLVDFWEFDDSKSAWKFVNNRPRKRLFAPVGKDCPFDAKEITAERLTEWKCRGVTSQHRDNWQTHPYQRISSKSWTGCTWFFPINSVEKERGTVKACQANVAIASHVNQCFEKRSEYFLASLSKECPDESEQLHKVAAEASEVKPSKARKIRGDKGHTMFEFCCSDDSMLGRINLERGVQHFRLSKESSNMADDEEVNGLLKVLSHFPGADLWGSIPCGPWCQWQFVNASRLGKSFRKRLAASRRMSRQILNNYIRCAKQVLSDGGHVAFEWPRGNAGWKLPELTQFVRENNLFIAEPDGCVLGLVDSKGNPHLKQWRIVTSSYKLARNLDAYKCEHPKGFHYSRLEGAKTPKSAFYTEKMCRCISTSLYAEDVPIMPTFTETCQNQHQTNEPALDEVFAGIHMLLDRKDWHKHEGAKEAIQKEFEGILANGTWSYDEVIPRAELMKCKEPFHIGRIMTILSIKHFELPTLRKLKARIVFRGDQIKDGDGNLAVLMDSKVCPAGMSAINGNLAFGALKGNKTTQSDVVRAYLQSVLETKVPTYVELPEELVPEHMKHVVRPCVRLWRSLYGHPESGYHWDQRFRSVMSQMNAVHLDNFPSNFWLSSYGLLLTLYVDDILISGPSDRHAPFWEELQRHLEIDEPTDVNRVLGRGHAFVRDGDTTTCTFEMTEFIDNACFMYEELSGRKLKSAQTPYVPDGSLTDDDWDNRGSLSKEASRVLMKILWCARLAHPDLMKGIADLTRRLTVWARADDKRLHRLMSYLYGSREFRLKGQIADPADKLYLCLYTDADHCSAQEDTKSSSGMYLTLEGPNSFWPLSWASKKQSATARSTTEAEMISLGSGLFSEAIPMQEYFECILQREVSLFSYQDNSAVIQIVESGYSAKLRHLKKVFKLNIGSIHEFFSENEYVLLLYIKTSLQRADPFTKPLPVAKWAEALDQMNLQITVHWFLHRLPFYYALQSSM